jgi:hypothetical protein
LGLVFYHRGRLDISANRLRPLKIEEPGLDTGLYPFKEGIMQRAW